MRINFLGYQLGFKGRREDKNTVKQLKNNNNYSLTDPNQRRINQALENLGNYSGEENIDFLLDVANNLKYGTNINTGKTPVNDWKAKLKTAAESSLAHSNPILKEKYEAKINETFNTPKELTNEETAILQYKEAILSKADLESLKDTKNENIRSLERNMDYFITSSEIPIAQKLYVLKRLDYFMSPEYEINPQLYDKKTQVLAEMMNDMTINTKESKIPNIKAVNQKSHGMCAAISIVRKSLAYEDKPNFVDAILSELDSSDKIMVYDRFNLGSGKRIPVKKAYIDFDYAQAKGYRIIDAAATYWMNIADMYGINNENLSDYNPFDKFNFDAFQDAHYLKCFEDDRLMRKQCYYQALVKAQNDIGEYKSSILEKSTQKKENHLQEFKTLETISKYNNLLKKDLQKILPELDQQELRQLHTTLLSLQQPFSEKIDKRDSALRAYSFLPNEESSQKAKKIKQYLLDYTKVQNTADLDKVSENITDLIGDIHELSDKISPSTDLSKKTANARKAYESEAIYRASVVVGLNENDVLTDNLIKYNIPDRETLISDALGQMINEIEITNRPEVIEHLSNMFMLEKPDKEQVIYNLKLVKANFDNNMTELLDELYRRIGLGSRKDVLLSELQEVNEEIKSGNKKEQARIAEILNIENSKKATLNAVENFEKRLSAENSNEKTYVEILNKIGYKNQNDIFVERFQTVLNMVTDKTNADQAGNVKILKSINGLDETADESELLELFKQIGSAFNGMSADVDLAANIVASYTKIMTDLGSEDPLTIDSRNLVLKAKENRGELVKEETMKKLQDRFTKIDKIRSTDEFSSRHGKISQPELYKFSREEQNAIKQINKKLDKMYAEVKRNLNNQLNEIRPQLEEHSRYIGTAVGHYWVGNEGQSGLYKPQQVKILEQITDRPYYEEENLETAADLIINGTHSGISGSQVFHDRLGGHAQYVADIKKVGPQQKYAILHDNTWGASEHENTWIDSEGVTRTDYSDRRGGELGYITDENWRNGNYIENLTHKKGKITPKLINNKNYKKLNPNADNEFDFSLMNGIVINGKNPELKSIAGRIKDSIYIPETYYINDFNKMLSKMTKEEVEHKIIGEEHAHEIYLQRYNDIIKRIEESTFNKGINSVEDYNNLKDSDPIKIELEKVATKLANPNFYMSQEIAQAKTLPEIQEIRNKLKENAIKDFYYAFSKEEANLLYYAYEKSRSVSKELIDILNKNGVEFNYEVIPEVFANTAIFEKDEKSQFTGSLKDTINFVVNKTLKKFDENIPLTEQSKKAREEFKTAIENTLKNTMYYNIEDIESGKFRAKSIRKWIDRKFDPANDEEFVKIYRQLQDMTKEEFDKFTQDLTNEDIGIKNINGYDVLVGLKSANNKIETDLRNNIYYEELLKVFKLSETTPAYKYQKNQRSLRGAIYTNGRTFDDLYRSFVSSLNSLEYEKLFNKYKDINYRNYKAFPAYPKIDLVTENGLNNKISTIESMVNEGFATIKNRKKLLNTLKLLDNFNKYISKLPPEKIPSKTEFLAINRMAGEFLTNNYNDPDIPESLDAAYEILNLDPKAPIKEYQDRLQIIAKDFKTVEKINEESPLQTANEFDLKNLQEFLKLTILCNIPPKYSRIINDDLNNWINEEYKKRDDSLSDRLSEFELRGKLLEYSNSENNTAKTNKFTRIIADVNNIKNFKTLPNYTKEQFERDYEKANKLAEDFVIKYIKPEYQNKARRLLSVWINNETGKAHKTQYDRNAASVAKQKFVNDFKKYHYTKHPIEVFNTYIKATTKDSKIAQYHNYFQSLFENHLNHSKLIDIQSLLMEAVDSGNAAEIKNYFKDYYVYPYESKFAQTMDSGESISFMVKNLILNHNTETAKMFLEKLGLAETFIDTETQEFEYFDVDKKAKNIINIAKNTQANMIATRSEVGKLCEAINDSENIEKLIDNAKSNIIARTKKNSRQAEVKIYLEALDSAKARIQEAPELKRSIVINQYIDSAIKEVVEKSNEDSTKIQLILNDIILLYSFVEQLDLPEYTEAYKKQQLLIEKFEAFRQNYEKSLNELREICSNVQIKGI